MMSYKQQLYDIIDSHEIIQDKILPSAWAELHRSMSSDTSPWPGKFSFDKTPYFREILDCMSPDHPARIVVIMKGAQLGCSTCVMENAIGWIIDQNPGSIYFLTGDKELSQRAMNKKIDQMIDSCGLRYLIKPNVVKKRNMRTGDTSVSKEFPGGSLIAGSTQNANKLRQDSVRFGFIDDFEAAPISDKKAGSITYLIEQRFAAYYQKMKLYYISTPEMKDASNIEAVYVLGDQRRYMVPCPICGEYIVLEWNVKVDGKENAGIYYDVDKSGKVIPKSVGYVCQSCSGFFTDAHKFEMNMNGFWQPTTEPSEYGYYSYHISSLYAPSDMYDWLHYARQFNKAYPKNGQVNRAKLKAFYNVVLGKTWEEFGKSPKASQLAMNKRPYQIGTIPEKMSIEDGNGQIILITCAIDLNGKTEDARADYEIVAWSETGSSYSIMHGSVGTFIPRENTRKEWVDRERWSYTFGAKNAVWPQLEKILSTRFKKEDGQELPIFIAGLDCAHFTVEAYSFLEYSNQYLIGLRGKGQEKTRRFEADTLPIRLSKERGDLYLVEVNQVKDDLAECIRLKWHKDGDTDQPPGFMNYPLSSGGLYEMENFFSHYEAEHRKMEQNAHGENIGYIWEKKNTAVQNHMWDCRVYNVALKELISSTICRENKVPYNWKNFSDIMTGKLNRG